MDERGETEDTFWLSISKNNITTWYGRSDSARIADPSDKSRVFSWLVSQSHDAAGNAIVYEYSNEDSAGLFADRQEPVHERNRTDDIRGTNRYLKAVHYGNSTPYLPTLDSDQPWPYPPGPGSSGGKPNWPFEVVLDYDCRTLV